MKALYLPMMDLYHFPIVKGLCHDNQIMLPYKGKLILRACSPDGSTVSFRYYLLGGDTMAPSGLLARLCHAFLVSFVLFVILGMDICPKKT